MYCLSFDLPHFSINVVVISPDGQRHRQLLSSNDGLVIPQVLDYERSTNKLLVANCLVHSYTSGAGTAYTSETHELSLPTPPHPVFSSGRVAYFMGKIPNSIVIK
jgi:hypothetical protein